MKQETIRIKENKEIAPGIKKLVLDKDVSEYMRPGQFVNILIPGKFLRRPISLCDGDGSLTLVYKIVGEGTELLSEMQPGEMLDVLTGLGNGYDLENPRVGDTPVLVGGGSGIPPLYYLAKKLMERGKDVHVILGFNKKDEVYFEDEFKNLGCTVCVTTVDGSYGKKGFATLPLNESEDKKFSYYFACGPMPMLRSIYETVDMDGEMSFEERMGCGYGACMGCSIETKSGYKRICKEGPVLKKEGIKPWID